MVVGSLGLIVTKSFDAGFKFNILSLERLVLASELMVVFLKVRVASQRLLVGGDHAIFERRLSEVGSIVLLVFVSDGRRTASDAVRFSSRGRHPNHSGLRWVVKESLGLEVDR